MKRRFVALAIAGALALPVTTLSTTAEAAGPSTITVRAGGGTVGEGAALIPDGTAALDADMTGTVGPIAVQGDDTYVYVNSDHSVYRIDADDTFHRVAGNGVSGVPALGGPAVEQPLAQVNDMTVTPDGTVYLATDTRVTAVQPDGTLIGVTAAYGTGTTTFAAGMPALGLYASGAQLASSATGKVLIGSKTAMRWFDPVAKTLTSLTETVEPGRRAPTPPSCTRSARWSSGRTVSSWSGRCATSGSSTP